MRKGKSSCLKGGRRGMLFVLKGRSEDVAGAGYIWDVV